MISKFTNDEYILAKSDDKILCECEFCHNNFLVKKKYVKSALNGSTKNLVKFCNHSCANGKKRNKQTVTCKNCNKIFSKGNYHCQKTPNHFCSHSCSATYQNTHKTYGSRRSKLEIYLEEQLTKLYPILPIDFNKKDAIQSELDIYIPSLKLAFELNGIFHYEPIYGVDKLKQVQNNDQRKFQACIENQIELVLIDNSMFKHFKIDKANKFLDIITNIINQKLTTISVQDDGVEPPEPLKTTDLQSAPPPSTE